MSDYNTEDAVRSLSTLDPELAEVYRIPDPRMF